MMKRCLGCMETYSDELNICPHCGYVENSMPEEAIHMIPGTILHGQYIVGKVVGYGGFGVTYIAWDSVLEKRVAIKEYLPSEFSTRMPGKPQLTVFNGDKAQQFNDGLKKFLDEARRLAKFQDEQGIVKIYDCFEENGTAYIIMEYLEGVTLGEFLKENGTLPEKVAIQMMMPIMKSLKTVHQAGIIHRDIAPDNIMISTDSQIKLIDFGAARYATTSHSRSLTVIIKPGYSPEEQYRSRGDQGPHTDVYAVGAVLYKMITGKTPPDAMERRAYFENGKKDMLEPPSKYCKTISKNVENAILNAMNVRIEDRTPDMPTLVEELTTEEEVVRRNGKIKKIDILKWPLGVKIAVPTALVSIITLIVLFLTGVIGFKKHTPRDIYIPDGMTRVPRIVSMLEDEAQATLVEKNLNLVVSGKQYDSQIAEDCILMQELTVGSVVPINYNLGVVISAGERSVSMPFVVGFDKDTAIKNLEDMELSYEIIEDYDSVFPEGYICAQSIAGGTETSIGTVVTLTVSLGRDPDVDYSFDEDVMPDIVGISLDEAKKLCEKQGIILIVSEYQYNADYDAMYVLAQGVKEGEAIQKDATVEIVLSKGKQSYIVPDVVYFEEEEAINIIKERGLDCDITYKEDENVAEGCVVSQSVTAGTQAKAGDVISLVVSSGPPKFDMINVVGEKHKDAEEKLHELGLVVTVDYIYDENYELGTVIKQSEEKGAKVYKGYEITITVVSDEALINVPDVVGKDFDEATEMITSANLKVEKNEIYDNNVAAGLVISQAPQAGSSQKGGTKILLTVSLGKQPVTVKFNSLGGTCQESERTVYYTETYGELPVPTMQYHKFLGWYTAEKSGSQVEADTKVNNVNSQTLYARWERIYVRVAFDANGGKVGTSSTNIAMGEKYSLPTPERKYYSFDGWYTDKNGGTKVTSSDVMSTGERHTLYAHWTVKSVTVTYDAGSGNVTGDTNVKYNLGTEYGKKLATRTGYTFMGWYTKANGSGTKVLETDIVTDEKEHTLYAYWSNKAITITLDPRSGTLSERSIKAEYDKEYGTLPTPERKGYTFEGWYTSTSGGDRVTESSVCKDEKDATLYARWANQQFNVYFNSNGGSCSTNNKTVTYNNSYGDLPSATKTGYTFAGWYTESSGGRNVNQNTTYTDINDTTLYAHWNKNSYTVTFDANGGSCSTGRITVKYDDFYGWLPTPSYFRHTFAGWYTSRSGGSKIESGSIFRENRNITLYAHWNDIAVIFIDGDFRERDFGVGDTYNPRASASPSNATNTTITWRSNNTNIAKVDGNGNITGISKGTATITASCGGVSRNITVNIKNVVYGYDLSKGNINFGDYMYAPQNDWINGGKPGYQHIHIEFGTKNTVKDGNSVIFYSRRDVGMFGIFIENKKLVVAEVKDGNGHYNLCRTNITLQPNTKYRIEVDPSGTYNIVQNGQLVETGHFPDFRFIVGGSSVTSIPGAYTVMGSVESWYGGAYEGSPAADIYIYKIDSEAGFTHYVRGHGSHPGHAGATHIEVTSNGVINRGGNKDEWVSCDTSVTGINGNAITRILVDY